MDMTRFNPALAMMADIDILGEKTQRGVTGTDGIFEIENRDGEALLQNRLVRVVRDATSDTLEDLLGEVLERVLAFAETNQFDDDVCLLGMDLAAP